MNGVQILRPGQKHLVIGDGGIQIYSPPAAAASGPTGTYDGIANLVHGYGLHLLDADYAGNAIVRLRRDSDNAESDFTNDSNGDLDTAAIATWLGGATGYVVTLYDQIGSDNVTQATSSRQPLYVASGQNSKPEMSHDGTDLLQGTFSSAIGQPASFLLTAKLSSSSGTKNIMDGSTVQRKIVRDSGGTWGIAAETLLAGGASDTAYHIWATLFNGASSQFWIDTASQATGDAGTSSMAGITIGADYVNNNGWTGSIGDVLIANAAWSTAQRQAAEAAANGYWSAY